MGYEGPLRDIDPSRAREEADRALLTFIEAFAARSPVVVMLSDLHWADDVVLELIDELLERLGRAAASSCSATARHRLLDRVAPAAGRHNPWSSTSTRSTGPRPAILLDSLLGRRARRAPGAAARPQRRQPVLPRGAGRPARRTRARWRQPRSPPPSRRPGRAARHPARPGGGPPRRPHRRGAVAARGRRRPRPAGPGEALRDHGRGVPRHHRHRPAAWPGWSTRSCSSVDDDRWTLPLRPRPRGRLRHADQGRPGRGPRRHRQVDGAPRHRATGSRRRWSTASPTTTPWRPSWSPSRAPSPASPTTCGSGPWSWLERAADGALASEHHLVGLRLTSQIARPARRRGRSAGGVGSGPSGPLRASVSASWTTPGPTSTKALAHADSRRRPTALRRGPLVLGDLEHEGRRRRHAPASILDRGRRHPGRRRDAEALRGRGAPPPGHGRAVHRATATAATASIEEALAVAREVGDRRGEAWALQNLAWIAYESGLADEAEAHLERLHRRVHRHRRHRRPGLGPGPAGLRKFHQGDFVEAEALAERLLLETSNRGDRWAEGMMRCSWPRCGCGRAGPRGRRPRRAGRGRHDPGRRRSAARCRPRPLGPRAPGHRAHRGGPGRGRAGPGR